ncbi:hypothetical protein FHR99_002892 [Litorivivens lipolytica]|uniref:Uncharacterized protein n=1 Tax=Litorivivens lipolytica TaxID=1524264 RepID=A0A7W4Z6T6_9GAMM|nr:hypothetical protein [Litorivivens lipolytica]
MAVVSMSDLLQYIKKLSLIVFVALLFFLVTFYFYFEFGRLYSVAFSMLFFASSSGLIASRSGMGTVRWFFIGLVLGFVGLALLLALKSTPQS